LASEIAGYGVMTTDGIELGTLENVLVDPRTGALETLCVSPTGTGIEGFDRNEGGQLLISAHRVRARSDYVLVETDGA
jgi:sporulation protein YlmC with PRC-barrel domain